MEQGVVLGYSVVDLDRLLGRFAAGVLYVTGLRMISEAFMDPFGFVEPLDASHVDALDLGGTEFASRRFEARPDRVPSQDADTCVLGKGCARLDKSTALRAHRCCPPHLFDATDIEQGFALR
jgi:hypothetical protein